MVLILLAILTFRASAKNVPTLMFDKKKGGMKISIDLDGSFFAHPEFFTELATALQKAGHQVGVMTGRMKKTQENDKKEVESYGFKPDFFYNRLDTAKGTPSMRFKAATMRGAGIDAHFDDEGDEISKRTNLIVIHIPSHDAKD
jgi:hypothetical protein